MSAFSTSAIVFAAYAYSVSPSVPGGDAGELISEACIDGTPHPPGYPLFLIISGFIIRVGKWIKYSGIYNTTAALSVNLLCSLMGAGSNLALFKSIQLFLLQDYKTDALEIDDSIGMLINKASATIGAMLFSFSPLTIEYHTGAEVFALNNLLICTILYQTIRIYHFIATRTMPRAVEYVKGALLCGLALSNQHTSVLFLLPLVLYVFLFLMPRFNQISLKLLIILVIAFGVGLLPYIYLVLLSQEPKAGSWGDLTNVKGFRRHLLRSEYGSFSLAAGKNFGDVEGAWLRWQAYFLDALKQFTPLGSLLFLVGLVHSVDLIRASFDPRNIWGGNVKRDRSSVSSVLVFTFFFYLVVWNGIFSNLPLSTPMAYEVQARFWMQPNILYCFFSGVGCKSLLLWSRHVLGPVKIVPWLIQIIMLSVCIFLIRRGVSSVTSYNRAIFNDYGNAILDTVPENSLLLSHSDLNWNAVRYLQACEGKKKSITHISVQLLPYKWFQRQISIGLYHRVIFPSILPNVSTGRFDEGNAVLISRFLRANVLTGSFPGGVYIEMLAIADTDIGPNGLYRDEFTLLPWGLVFRVLPALDRPDIQLPRIWHPQAVNAAHQVRLAMNDYAVLSVRQGTWEFAAMSVFWDMHYQLGIHLLSFAIFIAKDLSRDHHLILKYVKCLKDSSKLLWQVYAASTKRQTISYPYKDIVKNTALAFMRNYEFFRIAPKIKTHLPSLPYDLEDHNILAKRAGEIVKKYLEIFSSEGDSEFVDKDYEIFASFYKNINDTGE